MKIVTFGCRLNTFESKLIEKIGSDLQDIVVVNTCAVTAEAERQCRQAIRKVFREYPHMKIIVTGCAAQLHPEKYAQMPEVFRVLGNREKLTREMLFSDERVCVGDINQPIENIPLVTDFEGRSRAFLQIQQGCNHTCTFCIVRSARGKNIGLPPERVLEQARVFVKQGFSEIVLTGVDITSYPYGFNSLIRRLVTEVEGLKRLRLGSLDPACVDDELMELLLSSPILMPHLHLSVQAGDNLVLKRMGRRHTAEQIIQFCTHLKKMCPDFVLGGDFITGFPTETEEQFLNTCQLVQEAQITQLHVFPYSVRLGTPAAKMPMVDMGIRKERATRLRQLGLTLEHQLLDKMIGTIRPVLIEREGHGYTDNYLKVQVSSGQIGSIIPVKITKRSKNELVGEA
ncbi:MAG: tRNA (N(6)-L-threonylcarbamoyladenosine(37)-C(2))-methylthiotransferase MtaB [Alphaproteobacteria bacterium]|nr:tRNA (N(6)-L-threonylcarbamoyladenosine(37)-C(2))-methylthiotransferase MtaB [Alphaproteobacteria bacterium]MBR3913890.1 tRNA (N(6)-L-threonylcarbamoyladenosine(37)-C(2))-methylthiotransferase MtaB [Alphaproteobacteria bacterium]